ncbi:hypothetical protein DLM76_10910 [Leptospira yasudae]|nr:hypothetical protein DLM76_10910 [Leptospira yasudae]
MVNLRQFSLRFQEFKTFRKIGTTEFIRKRGDETKGKNPHVRSKKPLSPFVFLETHSFFRSASTDYNSRLNRFKNSA